MQSSLPSSFDPRPKMNYDVFISFRGKDVRCTFVGYLYEALNRLGIKVFLDDKEFKIGDDLHDLFQIIEESRSAIVILSEDYASAKWCLRELSKIMDSMETTMDRVLPVFYYVDPSTVKDQSGSFKKSFDEHEANALKEGDNQEKEKRLKDLQNWRNAMKKIGNRTGVVITKNSSEVEVVNKIANQVFNTRRPKLEALDTNLVGMKFRLLQMNMHLALGLDDVRFVAIVGRGGIGKTTIVDVVFHCLLPMFEDHCYMKLSEGDSKQSLVSLQHQMLSSIFYTENFKIWNEKHGVEMIKNRLSGRKVLLVLDGIEEKKQLDKLAGSIDWFGPGSRVIITTRNKELLHRPNNVEMKEYNVEQLDHDSALQLFLKHAFGNSQLPNNNLMDLSSEMVEKVERLPLALEVIGSFLYHKEIDIWRETLKRLIKVDERNFFDVLKISYDGLGVESQQVFLDLACFFHRKKEDRVLEILESFGYSPKSEILLLMERCLIKVKHEKILMHDLILEMGREIVHKESLVQPHKQSRIWLHEDVYRRFAEKHGLTYIQGIVLSMENEKKESIQLDAKFFSEMTSLRILEINNVELVGDIKYLSQLLRLINWRGYPLKCLPPTFQSRYLFELLLPYSRILQFWEGKKNFEKLKVIDASNSEELCMTPDFSGVPNLERLVLHNCVRLCEVHPSINYLNNLILIDLKGCGDLKLFPPTIRCKNLQTLILSGTALESSPEMGENMELLTHLHLDTSNITQLHPSIGHLTGLVLLDLSFCSSLSSLPCEIGNLRSLKTLLLKDCTKLDQIPPSLANVESMEILNIANTSITHAPSSIGCLRNLEILDCGGLSSGIWRSLWLPQCNILKFLDLSDCKLVDEDVPEDLHCFSSLEILHLCHNDFVKLPDSLSHLKKLKRLYLNYCTKLKDLPKLPPSLQYVEGEECRSISEQFYNKRLHISSTSPHSLKLNFSILSKETTEVECTINRFQHLMLARRFFEVNILDEQSYYLIHGEVDTFECVDQINEGNWINIEYNQESSLNNDISNVCGVFLLANIEYHFKVDQVKCSVNLEIDGNPSNFHLLEFGEFKVSPTKSIWVIYIPTRKFSDRLMDQNSFSMKATISCNSIYVKVKACGASIIFWKNASEYLAKLFTKLYCSKSKFHRNTTELNHKSECRCDELEVARDDFSLESSGTTDSTCFLRIRNLKPILGRIFEEENNYNGGYFFPHINFFGWFKNQKDKNKVAVKLPVNIHKDKKWMGLAIFAIFSISENANCHCFDYEIQSDDGRTLSKHNCFIPIELLEYSNQILLIVFEPRNWYPYELNSSSNHVYISFNTNVERMRVELCGTRLVYKQNVEGLIQTIVDCIMGSGDDLYEYYNQKVMGDLLRMINSHKHKVSSLQNAYVNQPTTALTCTDSCFSVEQLLHGSFPHPLLQKSIKDRFGGKFDLILHGDMIPQLFTNRSIGNMAGMKFPPHLDANPNIVGLAVCAFVVVDQQMRKLNTIQERERYTKVLDLICNFRVDSYPIWPQHCHFVSQQKLLSQYDSQFIWLFYTPLIEFHIRWHNCNYFEMTLETSCDELFQVQHCGLHLIHKKERKEIDEMIMESAIPPSISHNQKGSQQ